MDAEELELDSEDGIVDGHSVRKNIPLMLKGSRAGRKKVGSPRRRKELPPPEPVEADLPVLRGPAEPTHKKQTLRWDHKVNLIGEKVTDPQIHCCELCDMPILIYGRMIPCKHVFCYDCARKCDKTCGRCKDNVNRIEQSGVGTVFVCTFEGPRHSWKGCRRTYLSPRDLQAHIDHRHLKKKQPSKKRTIASAGGSSAPPPPQVIVPTNLPPPQQTLGPQTSGPPPQGPAPPMHTGPVNMPNLSIPPPDFSGAGGPPPFGGGGGGGAGSAATSQFSGVPSAAPPVGGYSTPASSAPPMSSANSAVGVQGNFPAGPRTGNLISIPILDDSQQQQFPQASQQPYFPAAPDLSRPPPNFSAPPPAGRVNISAPPPGFRGQFNSPPDGSPRHNWSGQRPQMGPPPRGPANPRHFYQ